MKRWILIVVLAAPALAQILAHNVGGRTIASQYGLWQAFSTQPVPAGTATMTVDRCYVNAGNVSGKQITPWATNVPVRVIDANPETVTPSSVSIPPAGTTGPVQCTITATFTFKHGAGSTLRSGSFGLAEAVNDISSTGGVVTIDPSWGGSTSQITGLAGGTTNVSLEDLRSGTLNVYNWNGASYAVAGTNLLVAAGTTNGQLAAWNTSSAKYKPQTKPVIDVRDVTGVDCTGATDSSSALNGLTSTQDTSTGKTILIPPSCTIRLDSQWLINGQEYLTVDGSGTINQAGAIIFGCNGASGAVVKVNRSGYFHLNGVTIAAQGNSCSSNFTQSLQQSNSGPGYNNTSMRLTNFFFTSNLGGNPITNYVGFGNTSDQNMEMTVMRDGWIHCQNSSGSAGFQSNTGNADSTTLDHMAINGCKHGIEMNGGLAHVYNSNISGNGGFSTFGAGGAAFWNANGCVAIIISTVIAEGSGQIINNNNDTAGLGCAWIYAANNEFSFQNVDPAVYPINVGNVLGSFTFVNNHITRVGATVHNSAAIGSDSQGANHGPQGYLKAWGNKYDTTYLTIGESNPAMFFQYGQDIGVNIRNDNAIAPRSMAVPSSGYELDQTSPATSGGSVASPPSKLCGNYWNASVTGADCWIWQSLYGSGANPTSTYTLTHSGSSGAATVDMSAAASVKLANGNAGTVIASGTSTLGTSAISATSCATVVTTSATNVASTDSIAWSFNAAPSTGYTAGVHVLAYVTTNNVNFLVCNPTAGSLTPAAATLNWRVTR